MRVSLYIIAGGFALLAGCQTLDNNDTNQTKIEAVNTQTILPE